ncbi:MAG: hypothetical protein DHS80DRAFT_3221, partial [Piptocephalis tieghemiana]
GPTIRVVNDYTEEAPPIFKYLNRNIHGEGVPPLDSLPVNVCNCAGYCDPEDPTCLCLNKAQGIVPFDSDHQITLDYSEELWECGADCKCADECALRVVQHGRKVKVEIFRTADRGWGVRAAEFIPYGTFIGLYLGEVVTVEEATRRAERYSELRTSYLFDLDGNETSDSPLRYCVDAFACGNFTRFMNHSCSPNVKIVTAHVTNADLDLHDLALFACQNIAKGEEFSFDYMGTPTAVQTMESLILSKSALSKWEFQCRCQSDMCR